MVDMVVAAVVVNLVLLQQMVTLTLVAVEEE